MHLPMSPATPLAPCQLLRDDPGGTVERFLLDAAAHSVYFAHMLVCQLLSEGTPPDEAFNPTVGGGSRAQAPRGVQARHG